MLGLGLANKIYVAVEAVDVGKGFEGLYGLARDQLGADPLSGHLFLFTNQTRTRLKALVWDGSGLWVCAKRLEKVISRATSTTTSEVSLKSGRPHQSGIHLASIGHPLVGDPLYGLRGQLLETLPGLPGDGGYFLHAQYLNFPHPITGEQINLEAALPSRTIQLVRRGKLQLARASDGNAGCIPAGVCLFTSLPIG